MSPRRVPNRPPDVEIGAAASARKVRFAKAPESDVRFHGELEEGISASERENLPDPVEPGVEYRDVRIRWRAGAWVVDPSVIDGDAEEEEER